MIRGVSTHGRVLSFSTVAPYNVVSLNNGVSLCEIMSRTHVYSNVEADGLHLLRCERIDYIDLQ